MSRSARISLPGVESANATALIAMLESGMSIKGPGVTPRAIADQLLAAVDASAWRLSGSRANFNVSIAGADIAFDASAGTLGQAFEQLAFAVEARIAFERASAMLAAVPTAGPLPLWLVSGSNVLARWLNWSGSGNALRKALRLDDTLGQAPIMGNLARRARRELGQPGAKIRVRQGMAVGEEIEISEWPKSVAVFGETAHVRIDAAALPETLLNAIRKDPQANALRSLSEIVDHPFIAAADLKITNARNDGAAVVFELESHWAPLAPVPKDAWTVLPRDANPAFPWRPTPRETRKHDRLVEAGRHLGVIAASDKTATSRA